MHVERNPRGAEALYLQSLNVCFPGWGDERAYRWAFGRQVGGPPADLMLLRDGDELLAGSAVSYRTLKTADGREALVGIMTGSWTLPAARGRGAFTQIIDESVALTRDHGGALLLAFVTETNASFRRLQSAGSTLCPTRYVSSRAELPLHGAARTFIERPPTGWFPRFEQARPAGAHFHYAEEAQWTGQLLERVGQPTLFEVEGLGAVVLETHGDFDRVQALCADGDDARVALIGACLHRAQTRGKRLFLFESKPARAERLVQELGLDAANGYLTALRADPKAAEAFLAGRALEQVLADWSLDSGDRM
jgi:hypothetical protein